MKNIIKIVGAILISQCCYGQRIDFSVAERYFQITDSLRENISVDDSSWNSFVAMKGMKEYISDKHIELEMDGYRQILQYVYMPQNDSLLHSYLKEPEKYNKTYLVNQYKENEDALRQYIRQIRKMPDLYLDSVYENAYSMLPYKMQLTSMGSTVYFVPLFSDALLHQYDLIISMYAGYFLDNIKYGALGGHQLHHLLRRNRKLISERDKYLYGILTAVTDEGMADLIDKPIPDSVECPAVLKYGATFLKESDSALAMLDSAIKEHADGKQLIDSNSICNLALYGGHVPGYHMALVIERNGFVKEMIKVADDPLKFFVLYNKAALLDDKKPYLISDKTIAYIKLLMKKSRQ